MTKWIDLRVTAAVAVVAGLAAGGVASAADTPFYVQLQVGGAAPISSGGNVLDLDGFGKGALSGSVVVGGGFGYRLELDPAGWALRAEVMGTVRPDYSLRASASDGDTPPTVATATGSVESTMANFNLWLDIPTGTPFKPYIGGGIGEAWNALTTTQFATDGQLVFNEGGGSTAHFAYTAGAGVGYEIGTNWTLDIGYRYVDAGSVFTNGIITTVGGDQIQDTPIKTRLRTDEGAVTLRWML
jgi:opacity protein-like surface antigen